MELLVPCPHVEPIVSEHPRPRIIGLERAYRATFGVYITENNVNTHGRVFPETGLLSVIPGLRLLPLLRWCNTVMDFIGKNMKLHTQGKERNLASI